jgi:hypothetical protein
MPDEGKGPGDVVPTAAPTPAALDRSALDRVLARAAELNAHSVEPSEGMSEAELVSLGKEVGISPEHMRQALAEERTRVTVPEARGVSGSLFGATSAMASRVVNGTPAAILGALDHWMQKEEILRPKRRFADRLTWEARRDLVGNLQAGFNFSGRAYALKGAGEVGATVVAIDAQRCLVRLDADFADPRRTAMMLSGIWGAISSAAGAGVLAIALANPGSSMAIAGGIATAAVGTGAGIFLGTGAAQRRKVEKAQLALEQILDRLEHGEIRRPAGNPLVDLISTITR